MFRFASSDEVIIAVFIHPRDCRGAGLFAGAPRDVFSAFN